MLEVQMLVSFAAGGLCIAVLTLLAERVGPFWRGVILTFPSTLALGYIFIGLTKSPGDVLEAALIVPAALGPDYVFVASIAVLARFGMIVSLVGSFMIWAIGAFLLLQFPPSTFLQSLSYEIPLVIAAYLIVSRIKTSALLRTYPFTFIYLFLRSILGGSVIALIVFFSHTLGNLWGGLFSAFPAAFTATFIIYFLSSGKDVLPTVIRTTFFPGVIVLSMYGIVGGVAIAHFGVFLGTCIAYGTALLIIFLCRLLAQSNLPHSLQINSVQQPKPKVPRARP